MSDENRSDRRCRDADWLAGDQLVAFEQVLGQAFPVERLSGYIRQGNPSSGIILHGPKGVGKRAIAALYADALLCLSPMPSGSPCLRCVECEGMERRSHFYLYDIDARWSNLLELLDVITRRVNGPRFMGSRSVAIISHAEEGDEEELDRILKMLESASDTFIIFLADDLSKVSRTVRSRCDSLMISPLVPDQAKKRLTTICQRQGVRFKGDALDVISLQAKHRAGDLLHCLWTVAETGDVTLERVRQTFALNWLQHACDTWLILLTGEAGKAALAFDLIGANAEQRLSRMRVTAAWLAAQRRVGGAMKSILMDAALLHRNRGKAIEIISRMDALATARFTSSDELWEAVIQFWANCDAKETIGLTRTLQDFRAMIFNRLGSGPLKSLAATAIR